MAFTNDIYDFKDFTFSMLGNAKVIGVRKLDYKITQEKINITGAGGVVAGRSKGQKQYEGTITLLLDEGIKIREAANVSDLTDVPPFTLVASIQKGNNPIRTLILEDVEFNEDGFGVAAEDTNAEQEIPIIFSNARWEEDA